MWEDIRAYEFRKCPFEGKSQMQPCEQYPEKIVAGYHLNKKLWNTVLVESLPPTLIEEMVQHSYEEVLSKVPKKEKELITNQ